MNYDPFKYLPWIEAEGALIFMYISSGCSTITTEFIVFIILCNSNFSVRQVLLIFPFYRWSLSKVKELTYGPEPGFEPRSLLPYLGITH